VRPAGFGLAHLDAAACVFLQVFEVDGGAFEVDVPRRKKRRAAVTALPSPSS